MRNVRSIRALLALAPLALSGLAVLGSVGAGAGTNTRAAEPYGSTPSTATRYSLVHGCYSLKTGSGQLLAPDAGPFRMQATTLGQYLLYGVHENFLTDGTSGVVPAAAPSQAAVWQVDGSNPAYTITNLATKRSQPITFVASSGCAVYPEANVNATGTTFKGTNPNGPVTGTIDAHTHTLAYEFFGGDWHCGRPWHPYGVTAALPDCTSYRQGSNGVAEGFLDYGSTNLGHDPKGWPTFKEWPAPHMLAEEGAYWTGIQRAWLAGLRTMVVDYVDNEALCTLMTQRHNPCNDMSSVEIQWRDLHALQDYIDAQAGGPGKGFFRIVTNPTEARHVINDGKLAVIQGIELSDLFNCGEILGIPKCTTLQVDGWLDRMKALGITSFFPIHKFDNAFGGTKMDGGTTGLIVNGGNHLETGHFWNVQTCAGDEHDEQQLSAAPVAGDVAGVVNNLSSSLLGGAQLPLYPPAPHCNARGMTSLGAYLLNRMIDRGFIIELDHMDVKTANQALPILEARHYSGVVSSHSWDSPAANPRIYKLGGFITPYAGDADSFVSSWKTDRTISDPKYPFGIGYGSDMNGLGAQGGPTSANPISYPFTSFGGNVTFDREQWGQRTFDINTDGVANYGLYADWLQALQVRAGPQIMTDLFNGAEAYLQMWQRATS